MEQPGPDQSVCLFVEPVPVDRDLDAMGDRLESVFDQLCYQSVTSLILRFHLSPKQ